MPGATKGIIGRVLIIASGAGVYEQVVPILEKLGLDAQFCRDSRLACGLIRQEYPQLVLLDARIVKAEQTFCRQLRSSAPDVYVPIILVVPPDLKDIAASVCLSETDDFICAPFLEEELLARVLSRCKTQARAQTEKRSQIDYRFLARISNFNNSDLDTCQILQRLVDAIGQVIEVQRCSITLVHEDDQFGYVIASNDDPDLNGLEVDLKKYPEIQEAIQTNKPILIDNVHLHPLMESVLPYIERLGFNSLLVLPMIDRQHVVGVLVLRTARNVEGFVDEEISFCQLVANVATGALCLVRTNAQKKTPPAMFESGTDLLDKSVIDKRSALMDMAAHDLRGLVSVIDGYCLLLQETEVDNLTLIQSQLIDGLMLGCRRLVEMTNNLLDFSRIKAGKFVLEIVETDLQQLIVSATREIQPLVKLRRIKLEILEQKNQVLVCCDIDNIRRVFVNLMSNAIKFTPLDGTIELRLKTDSRDVCVSISDNGPGIAPEHLQHLFDEFSHRHSPDGQHGNGLGLAICKSIVEAHHGHIWAESILGQGSRFTFSLPRSS